LVEVLKHTMNKNLLYLRSTHIIIRQKIFSKVPSRYKTERVFIV